MNYESPIDALFPAVTIAEPVNDRLPTEQQIWESAMEGIEDPANFEYSESDQGSDQGSDQESEPNSELEAEETEKHLQIVAPVARPDIAESIGRKYASQSRISTLKGKPLSHTELIRELMLVLRQLPSLTPITSRNIRPGFVDSVIKRFQEYRDDIWQLDNARRTAVLDKLLKCKPTTLVQLSLMVEEALFDQSVSQRETTTFDASAINAWLCGNPYIAKQNLSVITEFVRQFADFPAHFKHRNVCMASCFALIASSAYNAKVPDPLIGVVSKEVYKRAVDRVYVRNARVLLDAGLRQTMAETWRRLASVYLAQDPRMLKFLDLWLESNDEGDNYLAQDLLNSIWPDSGVWFNENMEPSLNSKLPSMVEQFYGRNMCHVFHTDSLMKCWTQILEAIRYRIPETELDMASLAKTIANRITETQIPEPSLALF